MASRPPAEAADYFVRQGLDADGLAAELATPEQRRRYIATFYTSRFWAHPGGVHGRRHDGVRAASAAPRRSTSTPSPSATPPSCGRPSAATRACSTPPAERAAHLARNEDVRALLLFGTADHVIYPAFDEMAAVVFPDHVGPYRLDGCGHFVPVGGAGGARRAPRRFCADLLA